MKLIVEVLDASDLMPKDGQGSASPFVEVDFENQSQKTKTKVKDLNPVWNERFEFQVSDPNRLPNQTIDVAVYNDRKATGHHRNFLGRVKISGSSVAGVVAEAVVQRYPLDKRGLFSHIRGDIALKIYTSHQFKLPKSADNVTSGKEGQSWVESKTQESEQKKKQKEKHETMAIPAAAAAASATVPLPASEPGFAGFGNMGLEFHQMKQTTQMGKAIGEIRGAQAHILHSRDPEFGLVETYPALGGLGYRQDKTATTYDLVEQMRYLYVKVVKARDLPAMDITGSCDPYVEVKVGNNKGVTKTLEKNQNPVWEQAFAFSRDRLQSSMLEVVVKDKDLVKDDFVGRVVFDLTEVPLRVPPDSPLAPQWYRLEDKKGDKAKGEIMLGVWMGTQADEAFPDARHADTVSVSIESLHNTRSKVYFSPKLCYLRIHVIEAQDLVPSDKNRAPETYVKISLGNQLRRTRISHVRTINPIWQEELMFVAADPFEEPLVVTVEERVGPNKDEPLARAILPVKIAEQRYDNKLVNARWFTLDKPSVSAEVEKKKETKFSSRIHLRVCLDTGYHVLDESTHYSSDLRPTAKQLWKTSIGVLQLGILSARNLLPMKTKNGRTADSYCVAKYGQKWVRTRTHLDTLNPSWNEQYTWEVYDPCTVITIAVFDNCHLNKEENSRDQRIGKVRIRLSTLETDRIYTHYYPLLVLHNLGGLKKMGELQLALRFTCTSFVNMLHMYGRPLLPKMHYLQPLAVTQLDYLRHQAMQIVAFKLSRAEPPLRKEAIEYMLDVDSHMWSLRRSKANFYRIMSLLSGVVALGKWFDDICYWKNPVTTVLVHVLFFILVCYPELILPTVFLYLFLIGVWNYRFRERRPAHMDVKLSHAHLAHPDELDEEFDSFPTSRSPEIVKMRYDRIRYVAGRVQTVAGDLATQGERAQGILSWRDPRATAIFIFFSLMAAVLLYVTPFQVVALLFWLYLLRHPRFRTRLPSAPFNFYRRLPARSDGLL